MLCIPSILSLQVITALKIIKEYFARAIIIISSRCNYAVKQA